MKRLRRFTRARLTLWPKCMPTGLLLITARATACMPATVFCLTTSLRGAGKPLSRAKSRVVCPTSRWGIEECLYMGNIDSLRDWGHAKDYVRMQWMMLQQDAPEDFVIATGVNSTPSVNSLSGLAGSWASPLSSVATALKKWARLHPLLKGDLAPALSVGDVDRADRSAVLSACRGRDLARGSHQGKRISWAGRPRSPLRRCAQKWYEKI